MDIICGLGYGMKEGKDNPRIVTVNGKVGGKLSVGSV